MMSRDGYITVSLARGRGLCFSYLNQFVARHPVESERASCAQVTYPHLVRACFMQV